MSEAIVVFEGGVAEVAYTDEGVEVIVVDFDKLKDAVPPSFVQAMREACAEGEVAAVRNGLRMADGA